MPVSDFLRPFCLKKEQTMASEIKRPGVFITENDAFPAAIAGVATAVPAFIGYTETANEDGRPVTLVPTRIGSLAEYTRIFGGAYKMLFKVQQEIGGAADFASAGRSYALIPERKFNLCDSVRLFYANGGADCYIVSAGSYAGDPAQRAAALQAGLAAVHDLAGPTMLAIPEATLLDLQAYRVLRQAMLQQCYDRQDRVAILDVIGTDRSFPLGDQQAVNGYLHDRTAEFREDLAIAPDALQFGIAYAPFLETSVVDASEFSFDNFDSTSQPTVTAVLESEIDLYYPAPDPTGQSLKADLREIWSADPSTRVALGRKLAAQIPLLPKIFTMMAARRGTLPPSAAIAGVYTQNDLRFAVWKAPANVGLVEVTMPTLPINDAMLPDLDLPTDGLSVNPIRYFAGRGTVVWGARTLDGNSSDWRYVPVRRALIYIEQSVRAALAGLAFEPNAQPTWVAVTAMADNFLQGLWRQGGLFGDTPSDAFWVRCGLNSTMTPQDVLDGRLNVEIGLAPVRPAEFIVLRIGQQMQGGAAEPSPP
jgi:phage tail sheath protein FI